jgi:hypothetical protein
MSTGTQSRTRAPRIRVPNNEQAIISIGAERLSTILNCLSMTGGRIRASRRFASGTFADIEMKTVSGRFTAAIELLGVSQGNTQAFRFVQMEQGDRGRLQNALKKMHAQGFGEKQPTTLDRLLKGARRFWPQE